MNDSHPLLGAIHKGRVFLSFLALHFHFEKGLWNAFDPTLRLAVLNARTRPVLTSLIFQLINVD